MRPPGEIATAILSAAGALARSEGGTRRGPTLREIAHQAKVSIQDARRTVDNLRRAGKLEPIGERRVEYRNRPVVEYAPAADTSPADAPFVDLAAAMTAWGRR